MLQRVAADENSGDDQSGEEEGKRTLPLVTPAVESMTWSRIRPDGIRPEALPLCCFAISESPNEPTLLEIVLTFWFAAIFESRSGPTLLEIALIFGLPRFPSRKVNPLCLKSLWRGCGELREDVDEDRAESWSKAQ